MILLFVCNNTETLHLSNIKVQQGRSLDEALNFSRLETITDIGAYCLMPNHFHILAKERVENGISLFMKKLLTAYSMYFNKKYERTGTLFQGRFKAQHAADDRYLKYLFAYIHLNPVKIFRPLWREKGGNIFAIKKYLDSYTYSSLKDYIGEKRQFGKILRSEVFPKYFRTTSDFIEDMNEWLAYNQEII